MSTPAEDRLDIIDAIARLSHALDDDDTALLASTLAADGVLMLGDVEHAGIDSVAAAVRDATPSGTQLRRHVRNTVFDMLDIDGAITRSYFLVTAVADGGLAQTRAMGVYVDHHRRTGGEWRITRRRAVADGPAGPIAG